MSMLAIGIQYLTGCVTASQVIDRTRVEWPPHPVRVFMALAAAHFQTGEAREERAALEWLESQPPPELLASDCLERASVTHYVPVNDEAGGAKAKAPLQSAPGLTRNRQARVFARGWPHSDTVFLLWADACPNAHVTQALSALCEKVTRVGHSTSLVQMWTASSIPEHQSRWVPDEVHASTMLRIAGPGTLAYLEHRFRQSPRLWPDLSLSYGYRRSSGPSEPQPEALQTLFDHRLLVFQLRRQDGPFRHLDVAATLQVTARWREALIARLADMGFTPDTMPEVITGHQGPGRSEQAHVAFLPLPFVGREHASGALMGMALAVPRSIGREDRRVLLQTVARVGELVLGPLGRWKLERPDWQTPPVSLREDVWTAASTGARRWGTVTPVVLDRHAKAKDKSEYCRQVVDSLRDSCRRVVPQAQVDIIVTSVSPHLGAPPAHEFPRLRRKDGSDCRHTHAILSFDQPIVGPLLIGAGRYRGYGLCRPLEIEA